MKYLSIDIETTGLKPEDSDIVEFAAIYEDTENPLPFEEKVREGHVFNYVFMREKYRTDAFCARLHHGLWTDLVKVQEEVNNRPSTEWTDGHGWEYKMSGFAVVKVKPPLGLHSTVFGPPSAFLTELEDWFQNLSDWPHRAFRRTNIAGKNAAMFDLPFLAAEFPAFANIVGVRQRVIDPAILYADWSKDNAMPNTEECLARMHSVEKGLNRPHMAISDAWDVIRLVRAAPKR